ncbi:PP2C family protein-serine/threonine phosphatase [Amycolatopsis pittospori]|uniref:PP2C family protein-serine/threonine phosphatase n=1 Tax=Amycolatopsis pittospori TaxID=2749434 RepID=UPI001F161132|nr:PP2C family protein-serine/threonine phosphatase [Amycolatopsis pittospori]
MVLVSLPADEQRRVVAACFARTGLTLEQLWLRYFALGGDVSELELEAFLQGLTNLPRIQRDMVAHAVNERLDEVTGVRRAPYSRGTGEDTRPRGPLAALVGLLDGARRAPPERLPAVIAMAAQSLGLVVTVYLADYDQRSLRPFLAEERPDRAPLAIETTTAGYAYQHADSVLVEEAEGPRLWATLLDGDERMGVLELVPGPEADLRDPALRDQCQWLAMLAGRLLAVATRYGDGLDVVRRRRRRDPAAELLWQSLPPSTAATNSVVVAGGLEPAYEVRGVVFDYSLSASTACLALFDAGRDTESAGLAVSTALAAYRSARRAGLTLPDQEAAVDKALSTQFDGSLTVRGTLAELDLADGGLRYLEAGRESPIVLGGRTQTTLDGGRRLPFGSGPAARIATARLRPGDLLVLHTAGLSGARDTHGEPFPFADCLDHNIAQLPPETARRVLQAVKSHCGNKFSLDAGLLIARWSGLP